MWQRHLGHRVVDEKAPHGGVGPKADEGVEILGHAGPELEGFRSQLDRAHDNPISRRRAENTLARDNSTK